MYEVIFSVVMPVFNRGIRCLPSVESVLTQDHPSFELIMVDDGSSDDTPAVLERLSQDPRMRVFRQDNQGVSSARNLGASKAKGSFLIFLDSDDLLCPGYLSACSRRIGEESVRLFMASVKYLGPAGEVLRVRAPGKPDRISHGMAGSFAIERDFFRELSGYDPKLTYSENSDLFLRILKAGLQSNQIAVDPSTHVIIPYEDPELRNSRHAAARYDNVVYFIRKHQGYFTSHPGHLFNFKRIEGHSAYSTGRYTEAELAFRQALAIRPLDITTWLHWVRAAILLLMGNMRRP